MLNILNGQAMLDYFGQHQLDKDGVYVPFNEAMCVGRVSEGIFSYQFNKCRCDAHNITMAQYIELTLKPLNALFDKQFSNIVLWFDDDMFCQINLLTILAYLDQTDYNGRIAFNLMDHKFSVVDCFELDVRGYHEVYKQVMIYRGIPRKIGLPVLERGIELYFEYIKEDSEIIEYIRQNDILEISVLLAELFNKFPQYGLGDAQYIQLIEKYRNKSI